MAAAREQSDQLLPVTGAATFLYSVRYEPVGVPTHFPITHWLGWHVPVPALSVKS